VTGTQLGQPFKIQCRALKRNRLISASAPLLSQSERFTVAADLCHFPLARAALACSYTPLPFTLNSKFPFIGGTHVLQGPILYVCRIVTTSLGIFFLLLFCNCGASSASSSSPLSTNPVLSSLTLTSAIPRSPSELPGSSQRLPTIGDQTTHGFRQFALARFAVTPIQSCLAVSK
jgi:hypothetical protein